MVLVRRRADAVVPVDADFQGRRGTLVHECSQESSGHRRVGDVAAELIDLWSGRLDVNGRTLWNLSVLAYVDRPQDVIETLDGEQMQAWGLIRYVLLALPPARYAPYPTLAERLSDELRAIVEGDV